MMSFSTSLVIHNNCNLIYAKRQLFFHRVIAKETMKLSTTAFAEFSFPACYHIWSLPDLIWWN